MNKEKYIKKLQSILVSKDYSRLEAVCLEMAPKYEESFLYYFLGVAQFKMNMLYAAEYNLKKSIFLNKDIVAPYVILSKVFIELNNFTLAEEVLLKAMDIDQENIEIHFNYISILKVQNKKKKSLLAMNKAIKIFPKSKELIKLKNDIK